MKIRYHRNFVKNFKKRVARDDKLAKKFERRWGMFIRDVNNSVLRNHRLVGNKREYWSFWVTGDVRVIYKKVENEIWLYDIGTHSQVY